LKPTCKEDKKTKLVIASPTVQRPVVGFSYLHQVLQAYDQIRHPSALSVDLHVFLATQGRGAIEMNHKFQTLKQTVVKTNAKIHLLNTSSPKASSSGLPGIFRPISRRERQHNIDGLAIMHFLMDSCKAKQRQGSCGDNVYIMLVEDDWIPCPFFYDEISLILAHPCVARKDLIGLRIGSGGTGIIIPCTKLKTVSRMTEQFIDRAPFDSLLSWLLYQQPFGGFDKRTLQPQSQPYLTYHRNLFHHIGQRSSGGGIYTLPVPRCWEPLQGAGLIAEEHFKQFCNMSSFSPCTPER
jgi:hypothetical protein